MFTKLGSFNTTKNLHPFQQCINLHFLIFLFFFCSSSYAQSNKSVYLEVLGSGIVYSINYDQRFSDEMNGLGLRAGFGFIYAQNDVIVSTPVLINYLTGTSNHHFEVGIGGSFYRFPDSIIGDYDYDSVVGATANIGYRYQPTDGGFMFRAAWTPVISDELKNPNWAGLSFGYAF